MVDLKCSHAAHLPSNCAHCTSISHMKSKHGLVDCHLVVLDGQMLRHPFRCTLDSSMPHWGTLTCFMSYQLETFGLHPLFT